MMPNWNSPCRLPTRGAALHEGTHRSDQTLATLAPKNATALDEVIKRARLIISFLVRRCDSGLEA
jgi:hypothetical protein